MLFFLAHDILHDSIIFSYRISKCSISTLAAKNNGNFPQFFIQLLIETLISFTKLRRKIPGCKSEKWEYDMAYC